MPESIEQATARYNAAAHKMQTAVAVELQRDSSHTGTPKDLRVGVNSSLVTSGAIAKLLIDKGIITEEEYTIAVADAMEAEVELHQKIVRELFGGANVELF